MSPYMLTIALNEIPKNAKLTIAIYWIQYTINKVLRLSDLHFKYPETIIVKDYSGKTNF